MPPPPKADTFPKVVIRPIVLLLLVNHSAPSRPTARPMGPTMSGPVKVVTTPAVVIRPMDEPVNPRPDKDWVPSLVNHIAPSGPTVIVLGLSIPGPVKVRNPPEGVT